MLQEVGTRVDSGKRVGPQLTWPVGTGKKSEGHDLGSPYFYVNVGNLKICSLLDTGADASVLSYRTFSKIQRQENHAILKYVNATREDSLQGASGEGLKVRAVVVLRMKLGELVVAQKFHLVENIKESLLLGSDFFWNHNPEINFKDKSITIKDQRLQICGKFQRASFSPVTIACNTTIGPHSVNVLPCHLENDTKGDFIIEPSAQSELLADHPGLIMIPTVVNTETRLIYLKLRLLGLLSLS